jgi:hypothetical protein
MRSNASLLARITIFLPSGQMYHIWAINGRCSSWEFPGF